MTSADFISRRAVLATGGAGAIGAGLLLAGCSSSGTAKTAGQSGPTSAPQDSATAPGPVSAGPTGAGLTGSGAAGSAPASGTASGLGGAAVAKLADIPVGGSIGATLKGKPIVLSQPAAGTVVGFSAICTHQGCTVQAAGKSFDCPCHGSQFDAATGAVLRGPAPTALSKLSVSVSGGNVLASTT